MSVERSVSKTKKRSLLLARQEPVWTRQGWHTHSLLSTISHFRWKNINTTLLTAHVKGRPCSTDCYCSIKDSDRRETCTSVHELLHIWEHIPQVCLEKPFKCMSMEVAHIIKWETKCLYKCWKIFCSRWKNSFIINECSKWEKYFPPNSSDYYKVQQFFKLDGNRRVAKCVLASILPQTPRDKWPPGSVFRAVPKQCCCLMEMWGIRFNRTRRRQSNPTPPTPWWTHQSAQTGNILLFQKNGKIKNTRVSRWGNICKNLVWWGHSILFLGLFSSCHL